MNASIKRLCQPVWCKYGAPMGRPSYGFEHQEPKKFYLAKIPMVDGCYDPGGAYWGSGTPLYLAESKDGLCFASCRANSRAEAKKLIRETFPNARFYS